MVTFAPEVNPTQDPNYLNWSKPTGSPIPNTGTGEALKTAGTLLDSGVKIADEAVKSSIDSDVHKDVDAERDAFSGALTMAADGKLPVSSFQPQVAQATPPPSNNVMDANASADTPVPAAIDNGLSKIDNTQSALAGQKITETQYYLRLNAIAKDLRSSYPGYRDYIDQKISETTGVTPANAYIKSIIQDLNAKGNQSKEEQNKLETFIYQHSDAPGFAQAYAGWKAGTITPDRIRAWGGAVDLTKAKLQNKKLSQEVTTGDQSADSQKSQSYAQDIIDHGTTDAFYNQSYLHGMKPAEIADALSDATLHPEKYSEEDLRNLSGQFQQERTLAHASILKTLQTKGPDGKSPIDRIQNGPEVVGKMLDASFKAHYDNVSQMFLNQDFGMIHIAQNNAASYVNDQTRKLLHDGRGGLGAQIGMIGAFNKIAPNLSPDLQQRLFSGGNLDTNLQAFLNDQQLTAMTQYDSRTTGRPYTLSRAMDQLGQRAAATGKAQADPDSYQALMNLAQGITTKDPHMSDSAKLNLSVFFYDKDNLGILNKWKSGYIDPASHQYVPGRQDILKTLSAPEVTKELWKQSQNGHPDVWQNYTQWVQSEMGAQMRSDVGNLNDLAEAGKTEKAWPQLSYDSDNHKILIKNSDGTDLHGLQATRMNIDYRTVQNLNSYLGNMQEIGKHDGFGVDAFFAKSLRAAGLNMDHPLMKAIVAATRAKDANRNQ